MLKIRLYNHVPFLLRDTTGSRKVAAMVDTQKSSTYLEKAGFGALRQLDTRLRQKNARDNRGFTLIELLMVVAIIGVLATAAIPSFNRYIKTTRISACATDLRTIEKAITAYVIDRNALPAGLNDVGMAGRLDPWKRPYVYQVVIAGTELEDVGLQSLNTDYDLYSIGQDGASTPSPGNDPSNADDVARSNDGSYVGVRP